MQTFRRCGWNITDGVVAVLRTALAGKQAAPSLAAMAGNIVNDGK